jgi:F-type H+-transporting ATPase subunit delta
VSTSEAHVIARALYDSLIDSALQSLRMASTKLEGASGNGTAQGIVNALPADTPRQVQNFLLALAKEGRLDQLPHITRAFERFVQETGHEALSGEVTSAIQLDDVQRTRVIHDLRAKYGEALEVSFKVDPSIIGGLIIRIGDQVLDNSLRSRLSVIQRNMQAS